MMITGILPYGVQYNGQRHREVSLRLPTVGDNIRALDEHPDANAITIELAMMAYAMTKLGDIAPEAITYELLAAGMLPNDYDYLSELVASAKKKLREDTPA